MRPVLVRSLAALLAPVTLFAAEPAADDASADGNGTSAESASVDLPPMAPITPQPPEPQQLVPSLPSQQALVDTVVPAYGTYHYRPYHKDSRVETLYHEIRHFVADLETRILSGQVHRPRRQYEITVNQDGLPEAAADPREPLPEEQQLLELFERLVVLKEQIPYPNHYEAWHFENSWRDIENAAAMLRLGLSDNAYMRLEELHQNWLTFYRQSMIKARADHAQALVDDEGLSPGAALAQAEQEIVDIEYPPMRLDGEYPEVVIPEIARKEPTPEPEPEPEPERPTEEPDDAPEAPAADDDAAPDEPEAPSEPKVRTPFDEPDSEPPAQPTPEAPAAEDADAAASIAEALHRRGEAMYTEAVEAGNNDRRDQLYNEAQLVLQAAVDEYSRLVEADPDNAQLGAALRDANRLRYGSIKQARTDAESNREAVDRAEQVIEEVRQEHAELDEAIDLPEVDVDDPAEEPAPSEAPAEEPAAKAEGEQEAPAAEDSDEAADDEDDALDDLDLPDL